MSNFTKSWLGVNFAIVDVTVAQDQTKTVPGIAIVDATGNQITSFGGGAITSTQLPATLGPKTGALSLSVVPNTDTAFPVTGIGASQTTATANPVDIAGVFVTGSPTLTTGQKNVLSLGLKGRLLASSGSTSSGTDAKSNTLYYALGDINAYNDTGSLTASAGHKFNGSTWDRDRKPNLYARVASSATSGNPAFLKNAAGDVHQFWGVCGATAAFLQLYNKASAPTIGTDTPVLTFPIPANGNFSQIISNGGAYFSTGIAYAFTTDAAATTGSAAAAITSFALLGA